MMVYRSKKSQPFKWILALILFVAVMTITFDDVDGFNLPAGPESTDTTGTNPPTSASGTSGEIQDPPTDGDTPSAIPEPATLLLMASGLGALYVVRKHRAKK